MRKHWVQGNRSKPAFEPRSMERSRFQRSIRRLHHLELGAATRAASGKFVGRRKIAPATVDATRRRDARQTTKICLRDRWQAPRLAPRSLRRTPRFGPLRGGPGIRVSLPRVTRSGRLFGEASGGNKNPPERDAREGSVGTRCDRDQPADTPSRVRETASGRAPHPSSFVISRLDMTRVLRSKWSSPSTGGSALLWAVCGRVMAARNKSALPIPWRRPRSCRQPAAGPSSASRSRRSEAR